MDLMTPRYKVIGRYPDSPFEVGEIITKDTCFQIGDFDELVDYPSNFRPLEWWEDRKPEEMPMYVKCVDRVDSHDKPIPDLHIKVRTHFTLNEKDWRDSTFTSFTSDDLVTESGSYSYYIPSTEAQYLAANPSANQNTIIQDNV